MNIIHKIDNMEEMDKFLETYNHKTELEEIENMNRPITSN